MHRYKDKNCLSICFSNKCRADLDLLKKYQDLLFWFIQVKSISTI